MTDEELTIVQEHSYLINQNIRYPKCVVDNYQNAHSIYEQGNYGCNENKSVYYKKMNAAPLLRVVCPNDSVLFVEMTGSGTIWEGVFTPPELGIYNVRVSASDIDGNTGVDFYQFEYTGPSQNGFITGTVSLEGGIGDIEEVIVTAGNESTNPDSSGFYSIEIESGIYDVTATLEYYDPDTVAGVIVEEGTTSSGVDLILVFNPPLNPPQNFQVDPYTGLATWDPPIPVPGLTLLGYNLYIEGCFVYFTTSSQFQFTGLTYGVNYTFGISAVYDAGESVIVEVEFIYLGTGTDDDILCLKTELIGNYPNPFNPSGAGRSPFTTISFNLTAEDAKNAELIIYNFKGQKIKTLECNNHVIAKATESLHHITWNGTDDSGKVVSSGVYFYQLKAGKDFSQTKRMLLLK